MANKKWFATGKDGKEKSSQVDAESKARHEAAGGPRRFYQKNDTSSNLIFLDSPNFFVSEHNLQLNGKWFNYFTCLKDFDTCPICEGGNYSSYCVVGTVIDTTKWVDDKNVEHKNEKKLFVAKGKARQALLRRIDSQGGDIKLALFAVARGSSGTEAGTGKFFAA